MSGNQALNTNMIVGPQANLAITNHGSDWYFAATAIMAVSALIFMGISLSKPISHRFLHQIAAGFCFVAAIGYWSAASGLGQTPVVAEFSRPDRDQVAAASTREIFYVRYIDWAVSMPLVIFALTLSSGVPLSTVFITMLATEIFNVTFLVGALTQTTYKWGFFGMAVFAECFIFYQLIVPCRKYASAIGGSVSSTYMAASLLTVLVWMLYLVAWGLSEGANVIHPDSEAIFYGVLDVFAKPIVGFILVLGHRNTEFAQLGFPIQDPGTVRGEKSVAGPSTGGVSNNTGTA